MQAELVRLWFPIVLFVAGVLINFTVEKAKPAKLGECMYFAGLLALAFKF